MSIIGISSHGLNAMNVNITDNISALNFTYQRYE